jgi:hypothetical protein
MKARLNGVALGDKILAEEVGDVNVLRSRIEAIKTTVGVFFELAKVCEVKLIAVVVECPEEARAQVVV